MSGPWSPGAQVGPYLLERELGRGGMGVVFLARDTQSGAQVVLKTLTTLDGDEVARLEREGLALARLEHPNLVRVHGAGWHERRPYLVLQFASGGSLDARLQRGPLPWAQAVELGAQLASALAAAHAIGIFHRDLKPQNVLLDERGAPLLADFGLAKLSDLSRLTETGTLMGTPLFMAPEQARGEDSGAAADVYSLGALLYAALAGRPPIAPRGGGVVSLLMALQAESPPRLGTLVKTPRWLEDAIHAALAREPRLRPSAAALAERLVSPPPPGNGGRRAALALALVLSALAGTAAWIGLSPSGAPSPQAQTRPTTPSSQGPEEGPSPSQAPSPPAYDAFAALRPRVSASLKELQGDFYARAQVGPAEKAFFAELPQLKEPELARVGRGYTKDRDLPAQRRGIWASIELSRRGYFDWLRGAFRGVPDIRGALPDVQRLARAGVSSAQWLLHRIKTPDHGAQDLFAYKEAQVYLHHATSLIIPREASPFSGQAGTRRGTAPGPQTVGEAWLLVYRYEKLDPTTRAHHKARRALAKAAPDDALSFYLDAWRKRAEKSPVDKETLAFELMAAAEWSWSCHLRRLGHPFSLGLPSPNSPRTQAELREEIEAVLREVNWGRGHYLLALTHLPRCSPTDPEARPADLAATKRAAQQALDLDPGLTAARLLLAQVYRWEGDHLAARREFMTLDSGTPHYRATGLLLQALNEVELCEKTGRPPSLRARQVYETALRATWQGESTKLRRDLQARFPALTRDRR